MPVLLLAAVLCLPDPQPKAAKPEVAARIAADLAAVRAGDAPRTARAVRDLALLGARAVPAIAARLIEAPAGERILLLTALSPVKEGRRFVEAAKSDPDPTVRAWASRLPLEPALPLRRLAVRYLEILTLAAPRKWDEAKADYRHGIEPLIDPARTEPLRRAMKDPAFADRVRRARQKAADLFAHAGARALAAGRLKPRLEDPVFLAYLALLRETDPERQGPFKTAVEGIVSAGTAAEPVLMALLSRENYDASVIVRLLFAVRADLGAGLFDSISSFRPAVRWTLLKMSWRVLTPDGIAAVASRLAVSDEDGNVRRIALEALERLDPPAGADAAAAILAKQDYLPGEVGRACDLLARAGRTKLLVAALAEEPPPPAGTEGPGQGGALRRLQSAAIQALRRNAHRLDPALGKSYLKSPRRALRTLGIDLVSDPETLLRYASGETDPSLKALALERALSLGGRGALAQVLAAVRILPESVRSGLLRAIRRSGHVEVLVTLAVDPDPALSKAALKEMARCDRIDPKLQPELLRLYDQAGEDERRLVLPALVPLGTKEARARVLAAGLEGLQALRQRTRVSFSVPLLRYVAGADSDRLRLLGAVAMALQETEPGTYVALLDAWDRISGPEAEGRAEEEKGRLFGSLARSTDGKSALILLDRLVSGAEKRPSYVLGTLEAAAQLVPAKHLLSLLAPLRAAVAAAHPLPGGLEPPDDEWRSRFVWGAMHALGWAKAKDALPELCDIVLDPRLQPGAFRWHARSRIPEIALNTLRLFDAADVKSAMREALSRAERSGALAGLDTDYLYGLLGDCRRRRAYGRKLDEVALLLASVLKRLPYPGDLHFERMLALGSLKRYSAAAVEARAAGAQIAALGYPPDESPLLTTRQLKVRALLYDAVAARKSPLLEAALKECGRDPYLLDLAAWYGLFLFQDRDLAGRAAEACVRDSGGLYQPYRDVLASVRIAQGKPAEALRWLDVDRDLPVERPPAGMGGWYLLDTARAYAALGESSRAESALESALQKDRSLFPYLVNFPEIEAMRPVLAAARQEYLDDLFRWE